MASDPQHPKQPDKFLVVRCGSEYFLLEIGKVRRVLDKVTIYPSPFTGQGILGLARFGGEPVVVLSLESLASMAVGRRKSVRTVVVVNAGNSVQSQRLALAVDEALEILSLDFESGDHTCGQLISEPMNLEGRTARRVNLGAFSGEGDGILFPEPVTRSDV